MRKLAVFLAAFALVLGVASSPASACFPEDPGYPPDIC
jgi:hypothetical protein